MDDISRRIVCARMECGGCANPMKPKKPKFQDREQVYDCVHEMKLVEKDHRMLRNQLLSMGVTETGDEPDETNENE